MKVYNHNIFVFLIKVFSQKSYREDFINGKLYLKEVSTNWKTPIEAISLIVKLFKISLLFI